MERVKVINGYSADARFYAELGKDIGYIPRQCQIPSPYAYSPVHIVSRWKNKNVIHVETKHRRYEVFEIPAEMITTEKKATELYLKTV